MINNKGSLLYKGKLKMEIREKVNSIITILKNQYSDAACSLTYEKPYELLFATRLAAQCTDARVNIVTKKLFKKYPSLEAFKNADLNELMEDVRSCGFYKVKAANIKEAAEILVNKYNGRVPDNMDELLTLPGVGRKTANLILGDIYHKPAIVTDTHCIRISNRLGLVSTQDPLKVELGLKAIIPEKEQSNFCHRLVFCGRDICTSRSPKCNICPIYEYCDYGKNIKVKNNSI